MTMNMLARICIACGLALLASGCATEERRHLEGVTFAAGNAMAANTAMQMVDPWLYGVQNTKLRVPAARAAPQAAAAETADTTTAGSGPSD
jgi:hypothetical protein